MSVHSSQKKKRRDPNKLKFKSMGKHDEFLSRITKTLYYGKLPITERLSLPVTEFAAELYSEVKTGRSLERLRLEEAAEISRNACVSPCSLVLAMLYLERLKAWNPSYVDKVAPSELFLISMMVASKFLNDDGEEDEVLNSEWASSAGIDLKELNKMEKDFLSAINWEVFIKESSFWSRLRLLERDVSLKEGKRRGWFSYTELENLLDCLDTFTLAQALLTVSAVCLASYTAGVLTVVGSTMIVSQIPTAYLISRSISLYQTSIPNPLVHHISIDDHAQEIAKALSLDLPQPYLSNDTSCEASDQNWGVILYQWLKGSLGNHSSYDRFERPFETSVNIRNDRGTSSCFTSINNYIQAFSQNVYFPIELAASH